jgi:hypothetical protein
MMWVGQYFALRLLRAGGYFLAELRSSRSQGNGYPPHRIDLGIWESKYLVYSQWYQDDRQF